MLLFDAICMVDVKNCISDCYLRMKSNLCSLFSWLKKYFKLQNIPVFYSYESENGIV